MMNSVTASAALEAEQAILGALLADASCSLWLQIGPTLKPEHFYEPLHARLFEIASRLLSSGKSATPITLKTVLSGDGTLDQLGGMAFLACLVATAAPAVAIPSYVSLLREMAIRRTIITAGSDLAEAASAVEPGESIRPALARHVEEMQRLFDDGMERKTTYTVGEAGASLVERISRIRSGEVDRNAINTSIPALDRQTGGLHRGEYIILGGRPSMGKTAVAIQLAFNVAQRGGGVFYASLEMPVNLLMPRLASCHLWSPDGQTGVDYQRILRGTLNDMEARWVSDVVAEMKPWPLIIDDAPGLAPSELEARAQVAKSRMERSGRSLDLVIVDHLHKMRQPGAQSKVSEYTEISARLAEMAKRLDCPVLTLAQLNRGVEYREDKRPQLADLRELGSIEQDADTVLFVYRPAYYLDRQQHSDPRAEDQRLANLANAANSLELIIEEQRSGPIGTVYLWCDVASNVVRDPQREAPTLERAA